MSIDDTAAAAAAMGGRAARPKIRILLVEDDSDIRLVFGETLRRNGWLVTDVGTCKAAKKAASDIRPSLAVLDHQLPDGTGLELIQHLRELDPEIAVIILTAHSSIEFAVEAMRAGANHFLPKPVHIENLISVSERCLEERRGRRRQHAYEIHRERERPHPFHGVSDAIRQFETRARKIADCDGSVLLLGETGCGKGVLAHWLHDHSPRADEPFVEVNCAGLKSDFLESELFGHKKGAFTGAHEAKRGLLEVADHGTFFLDEIGEMDLGIQAKLLKVLEEQTFRPLGGVTDRKVDVRLIAATHRDLLKQVRDGAFRADLYYRIHTLHLEIPPLRKRRADVPILIEQFLPELCRKTNRPLLKLSTRSLDLMSRYDWPGNIRELRNVLERAILLNEGSTLEVDDLQIDDLTANLPADRPPTSAEQSAEPPPQAPTTEPEKADPWSAFHAALREQILAANARGADEPIARWLADDLLLCAEKISDGGLRVSAAKVGIPKSTFARRRRRIDPQEARPEGWERVRELLPSLLKQPHPGGDDLLDEMRRLILAKILRHGPQGTAQRAALMDVSTATFRSWEKESP